MKPTLAQVNAENLRPHSQLSPALPVVPVRWSATTPTEPGVLLGFPFNNSYLSQLQALRNYAASKDGAPGGWAPGGKAGGRSAAAGGPPGKPESLFVGPSRPRTAAARALLAGTTLHPVVRLGWKPLCEVHCNGCAFFWTP